MVATCLCAVVAEGQEFFDQPSGWLLFGSDDAAGAEAGELETDRDSFTPATTVVERGRFLAETSYSYVDGRGGRQTHSFPELLTRTGLTENIEFRLGWNYEIGSGGSVSGAGSLPEVEDAAEDEQAGSLLYGLKASLTDQRKWLPQSAFIAQANTPTSGPDPATQMTLGYVLGWTLPNEWVLDSALRYGLNSEAEDHFNTWAPSVVLKVPVHERWNAHVEYFGTFTQNREEERAAQYASPGIHYLISPDCEIGVRVGWGLTRDSAEFFSNVGLGARF